MDSDLAAIKNVLNHYALHCSSGDFDAWLALWTADGTQMPPNAPSRTGTGAIREGMKPVFDEMHLDISIHSIDEAQVHGDWGLTRCTYSLTLRPKAGGEPIPAMPDGKALTLYGRQADGTWRITYDCFNSSAP